MSDQSGSNHKMTKTGSIEKAFKTENTVSLVSKLKDFQATQNFSHLPKFRQSHDKPHVRFRASDTMKLPGLDKPLLPGRSSLSSISRLKHGNDYRSKQEKFRL